VESGDQISKAADKERPEWRAQTQYLTPLWPFFLPVNSRLIENLFSIFIRRLNKFLTNRFCLNPLRQIQKLKPQSGQADDVGRVPKETQGSDSLVSLRSEKWRQSQGVGVDHVKNM
jgi:hypothetical protein